MTVELNKLRMIDEKPISTELLRSLGLVDSPQQEEFDNLTKLTTSVLDVPVSLVSIVDFESDRQFFKSQVGLPSPWCDQRQTPLSHSFCKHVVSEDASLVVTNAPDHEIVKDNKAIDDLNVVSYLGAPIYGPDKVPVGSLCAIDSKPRDWTDKQIETIHRLANCASDAVLQLQTINRLSASEQTTQVILESATTGLLLVRRDHSIAEANSAANAMFGLSNQKLIDRTLGEFFPGLDRVQPFLNWETHFESSDQPKPDSCELVGTRADGTQFQVETGFRTVVIQNEKFVVCSFVELSSRRRLEWERERFFNVANDLFCIADKNGYFRQLNRAWTHTLGHSHAELREKPFLEFVHPEDKAKTLAAMVEINDGKLIAGFTNRYRCKDGSYRWLEWSVGGTAPDDDTVIVAAARDVTDRIRSEQKRVEMNDALIQSNQALDKFAHLASHDLKEPLRKLSLFCQLLEHDCHDKLSKKGLQYIDYINQNAARMKLLIEDLLELSKVESESLSKISVDCQKVVEDAIDCVKEKVDSFKGNIRVEPLPKVNARKTTLGLLFQNLLSNAVKYSADEPVEVCVSADEKDECWQFSIEDNGIGIHPVFHQKIFDVFERLHSNQDYPGTGIGLAICKRIVERNGGKIWVESEEGRGSKFLFTVPK